MSRRSMSAGVFGDAHLDDDEAVKPLPAGDSGGNCWEPVWIEKGKKWGCRGCPETFRTITEFELHERRRGVGPSRGSHFSDA